MLSFTHPGFLWLLSGIAVPLVLHLLSLRQVRVVVFPSVRFLRVSRQPQEGRRRLRDIFLLLLRMLMVLSAVLLLAGAHWVSAPETHDSSASTHVFFLDASASMSTGTRWSRALDHIRSAIDQHRGDFLGLVVSDGREVLAIPPTQEHWRLTEALGGVSSSNYPGQPKAGLSKAVEWLSATSQGTLEIISDFQVSDWDRAYHVIPPGIDLRLHDVKVDAEGGNCGIIGVTSQRLPTGSRRVMVDLQSSHSLEFERTLTVHLGGQRQVQQVSLPPWGRVRKVFLFDSSEENLAGTAVLPDDAYPKDNRWEFWGDSTPVHRVLLLSDMNGGKESLESSVFFQLALKENLASLGCAFEPVCCDLAELDVEHFKECHGIAVLGCASVLEDWVMEEVRKVLSKGGVLFVTPGRSPAGDLDRFRSIGLDFGRFLGLREVIRGESPEGVGKVASDSVLGPLFKDSRVSDLFMFPIQRCVRLRPGADSQTLLTSLTGLPLLLEHPVASGRAFFMAFGFTPFWSNFPVTTSFLPLIRELMSSSLKALTNHHRIFCGTDAFDASGLPIDTVEPGVSITDNGIVEINVDPREGRMDYVSSLDLMDLLTTGDRPAPEEALDRGRDEGALTLPLALLLALSFLADLLFCLKTDWRVAGQERGRDDHEA